MHVVLPDPATALTITWLPRSSSAEEIANCSSVARICCWAGRHNEEATAAAAAAEEEKEEEEEEEDTTEESLR